MDQKDKASLPSEAVAAPEKTLESQKNNPLHGITLEQILTYLVAHCGWIEMNRRVEINCFFSNPSIKSSLKFLRKNNWARLKVERMYLEVLFSSRAK